MAQHARRTPRSRAFGTRVVAVLCLMTLLGALVVVSPDLESPASAAAGDPVACTPGSAGQSAEGPCIPENINPTPDTFTPDPITQTAPPVTVGTRRDYTLSMPTFSALPVCNSFGTNIPCWRSSYRATYWVPGSGTFVTGPTTQFKPAVTTNLDASTGVFSIFDLRPIAQHLYLIESILNLYTGAVLPQQFRTYGLVDTREGVTPDGPIVATLRTDAGVVPRPDVPFNVTATVVNQTGTGLNTVKPTSLVANPATGVTIGPPTPASVAALADGEATTFTWPVTAPSLADALELTATIDAVTTSGTARTATAKVSVSFGALVVNRTSDEQLDDQAVAAGRCDVDPAADGSQCTLRAAIQLVNRPGAAVHAIAFAIPGAGTPTITPGTPLPAITADATIDGTTQPGGWVALDGANTTDAAGIDVNGGSVTIRGMVIGRFKYGIWLRGGAHHLVAGNRIGTDPSGTQAAPNEQGISVEVDDVVLGGTQGVSTTECTGDCNLVSGNSLFGVFLGGRGEEVIAGIDIFGNSIGTDVSGAHALANLIGIKTVDVASVNIGGSTPAFGTGPGNLISGNQRNLSVAFGFSGAIRGNVFGTDRAGEHSIYTGISECDVNSIDVREAYRSEVVIGGPGPGDGNLISGFPKPFLGLDDDCAGGAGIQAGISRFPDQERYRTADVVIEGNRIGTNREGTAAVGNGVGIAGSLTSVNEKVTVRGNLISGNELFGVEGAGLVVGNRIGTNAAGTAAIPGQITGVYDSKTVGGIRPTGSTTCEDPCNLVSGNAQGIGFSTEVLGNFVGTDITGLHAIPNGGGVDALTQAAVTAVQVGGASSVLATGICDRACNLIAGNDGPGVRALYLPPSGSQRVQGNLIGAAIDGTPLPNHGGVQASSNGATLIGGPGELGNVIVYNHPFFDLNGGAIGIKEEGGLQDPNTGFEVVNNMVARNESGVVYMAQLRPPFGLPLELKDLAVARVGTAVLIDGGLDVSDGETGFARYDVYGSNTCESAQHGERLLSSTSVLVPPLGEPTFSVSTEVGAVPQFRYYAITATFQGFTTEPKSCLEIPGAVRTTTTAPASKGVMLLPVGSNNGFSPGDYVEIRPDGAAPIVRHIVALGSLIFDAPLPIDIPSGTEVVRLDAPPGEDRTAPVITVTNPTAGALITKGTSVAVVVSCSDGSGVGVDGCSFPATLDTATTGAKTLTVSAWDVNGNAATKTVAYTVVNATPPPPPKPKITLKASRTDPKPGRSVTLTAKAVGSYLLHDRVVIRNVSTGKVVGACEPDRCVVPVVHFSGPRTYRAELQIVPKHGQPYVVAVSAKVTVTWKWPGSPS